MAPSRSGQARSARLRAAQRGAMLGRGAGLLGHQERGADLHALGAECQCRDDAACVGDAPGGDHRRLDLGCGGADKRERPDQ